MGAPRSRAAAVLTNWRLLLLLTAGGVMALVVVSVVGFSGAYFTSSSTSPGNAFQAGSVDLQIAAAGELFEAEGLLPGDTRAAEQTVTNVQHRAAVTLTTTGLAADDPLADVLTVTVEQTQPATDADPWSGPLSAIDQVALGTFGAAEERTFRLELAWPAEESDPGLAGAETSFSLTWRAESVS